MMLKIGTCLIGLAMGVAIFIPRYEWGLIAVVFLLATGMVIVLASPRLRTDYDDKPEALPGPEGTIRRSEPGVQYSPIRGRHATPEAIVDNPEEPAPRPGQ